MAKQHSRGVSVLELDMRHPLPPTEDRALVIISDLIWEGRKHVIEAIFVNIP
jgi:hypothetical protein